MYQFYLEECVPLRLRRAAEAANILPTRASVVMANWDESNMAIIKQRYFELLAAPAADPKELALFATQVVYAERARTQRDTLHPPAGQGRGGFPAETAGARALEMEIPDQGGGPGAKVRQGDQDHRGEPRARRGRQDRAGASAAVRPRAGQSEGGQRNEGRRDEGKR